MSSNDALWMLGQLQGRQALFWFRQEWGIKPSDPHTTHGDKVVAVFAWLRWAASDESSTPLARGKILDNPDPPAMIPERATALERRYLEPFVGRAADDPDWVNVVDAVTMLAVRWVARADTDGGVDDGEIVTSTQVDTRVNLDDGHGATTPVSCPICGRDTGLQWQWDGLAARVACPCGHAEWTPLSAGIPVQATEWELITNTIAPAETAEPAQTQPADDDPPPQGPTAAELAEFLGGGENGHQTAVWQLRSISLASALLLAVLDHAWARTQSVLNEIHNVNHEFSPWRLDVSVAMKLDQHTVDLGQAVEHHTGRASDEKIHRATAGLLAALPTDISEPATALHRRITEDRTTRPALLAPPGSPEEADRERLDEGQVRVELVMLAARAAGWLTHEEITTRHMIAYSIAREGRQCAREAGVLPASARVHVPESEAITKLGTVLGRTFVTQLPTRKEERDIAQREMIAFTQRQLLDEGPDERGWMEGLQTILGRTIETITTSNRQRSEEERQAAKSQRRQSRKGSRKDRKHK